jgi:hypothetical protein
VIERNGTLEFDSVDESPAQIREATLHLQTFRSRRRQFDTVEQGLAHTERLVDAAVEALGRTAPARCG